jgi:hypothetical protein
MTEFEILDAFYARRTHYDAYLSANNIPQCTCPGCGFPSLENRGEFEICDVCLWEDDGLDDDAESILDTLTTLGVEMSRRDIKENRLNIGRMLETNAEMINGEVDFDCAHVLETIAFYKQRKKEIGERMTGEEQPYDHIWIEWKEVGRDLLMALVIPRE